MGALSQHSTLDVLAFRVFRWSHPSPDPRIREGQAGWGTRESRARAGRPRHSRPEAGATVLIHGHGGDAVQVNRSGETFGGEALDAKGLSLNRDGGGGSQEFVRCL